MALGLNHQQWFKSVDWAIRCCDLSINHKYKGSSLNAFKNEHMVLGHYTWVGSVVSIKFPHLWVLLLCLLKVIAYFLVFPFFFHWLIRFRKTGPWCFWLRPKPFATSRKPCGVPWILTYFDQRSSGCDLPLLLMITWGMIPTNGIVIIIIRDDYSHLYGNNNQGWLLQSLFYVFF